MQASAAEAEASTRSGSLLPPSNSRLDMAAAASAYAEVSPVVAL